MRHRRRGQHAQHRPGPAGGPAAAGIPRLRLLRRGGAQRRRAAARAQHRRAWPSCEANVAQGGASTAAPASPTRAGPRMARRRCTTRTRTSRHGPGRTPAGTASGRIALVHNGIIENHDELRAELRAKGYVFDSQTDTEVIAHLVDSLYDGDLFEAVQARCARLHGAYAIAVFCSDEPQRVIGARQGSPLILGVGSSGENFLASRRHGAGRRHRPDRLPGRRRRRRPAARQATWITRPGRRPLAPVERAVRTVQAHSGAAELGPYRHYMQKEIFEQPRAIADTLEGVPGITPELFGDGAYRVFKDVDSVLILACGTSYYAGSTAKYWLEAIAGIPTSVEIASEYRYRTQRAEPAHAGRHDHAKRRDRRHAGRAEARARARHDAHADDLQRRDQRDGARVRAGLHHARRRRDRRRLDQGLHHPAGRPVPADAGAGPGARPAERRRRKPAT